MAAQVVVTIFKDSNLVWKGDFFLLKHVAWPGSVENPSQMLEKGNYIVETKFAGMETRNPFYSEERTSMRYFLESIGGLLYEFVTQQQLE